MTRRRKNMNANYDQLVHIQTYVLRGSDGELFGFGCDQSRMWYCLLYDDRMPGVFISTNRVGSL
jgi:hypothetical protein